MIETAKLQKFVHQLQQYDIAVSNFKSRYNQLPGDANLLAPAGNNDGDATDIIADTSCNYSSCYEYFSFWKHLSDSATIKGSYTNDFGSGTYVPDYNVPKIPIGKKAFLLGGANSSSDTSSMPEGNSYRIGNLGSGDIINGMEWLSLDTKIDDAISTTGMVRSDPCDSSATDCQVTIGIGIFAGKL